MMDFSATITIIILSVSNNELLDLEASCMSDNPYFTEIGLEHDYHVAIHGKDVLVSPVNCLFKVCIKIFFQNVVCQKH